MLIRVAAWLCVPQRATRQAEARLPEPADSQRWHSFGCGTSQQLQPQVHRQSDTSRPNPHSQIRDGTTTSNDLVHNLVTYTARQGTKEYDYCANRGFCDQQKGTTTQNGKLLQLRACSWWCSRVLHTPPSR